MKTLRIIAEILMLITGVWHIVLYFQAPGDPGSIGLLVFGIIYILTGILLFTKNLYPLYLGVVLPLIGFTIYLIKFGFPALISTMTLLLLIDIIVILSCAYLLLKRKST
jgi:uncharacterized membrane protein HdeD (DUF308 family)